VRPTQEEVEYAKRVLEELAFRHDPRGSPVRNSTAFPDLLKLLDLFAWVDGEIRAAQEAAAYGPGVEGGYRTLTRGGVSDVDSRTHDQLLKDLRRMRLGWQHKFGQLVDKLGQEARELARWPERSEQVG
jgi:hypothetical protein